MFKRRTWKFTAQEKKLALGMGFLLLSSCASMHRAPSYHRGLLDSPDSHDSQESEETQNSGAGVVFNARASRNSPGAVAVSAAAMRATPLHWPLKNVQITSGFGKRGSEFHEGLDLRAKIGTPVFAAANGLVIYSGHKIRGYGNLIVIRHKSGLATIYAHNSKLLVRPGQKVRAGQEIALSGHSGHANGPHLHFEVRSGTHAFDPRLYMPRISNSRRLAYAR